MAKITEIMSDMEKVEKGVWVDYAAGIKLCIASINNTQYKKARSRLLKPYLRQVRAKAMNAEEILDILKPAAAKYLLIDWKNIEDEEGNLVEYSYEKALEFFKEPALSDLYNFVLETAGENEVYRQELVEDAEGNS